jgi:hypothetical protein
VKFEKYLLRFEEVLADPVLKKKTSDQQNFRANFRAKRAKFYVFRPDPGESYIRIKIFAP